MTKTREVKYERYTRRRRCPTKPTIVDLRTRRSRRFAESVVVTMGLDRWEISRCPPIEEARLLEAVRRALGQQVERLRMPPIIKDENASPFTPEGKIGVPVRPFPRWLRCVRCGLLAEFDSGLFTIKENPYRPTRRISSILVARKDHTPMRFPPAFFWLAAMGISTISPGTFSFMLERNGCKGTLRFFERGASLQTENLWVKCDDCGAARSLVHAFGEKAKDNIPACRGRHPHLDVYNENCDQPLVQCFSGLLIAGFRLRSLCWQFRTQGTR